MEVGTNTEKKDRKYF